MAKKETAPTATKERDTIGAGDVGTMPKEMLPALREPPSLLALAKPQDEVGEAFTGALTTPRSEVPGISIIRPIHGTQKFGGAVNAAELYGYPVHWFQARAYWPKGYRAGDSDPPSCWSSTMMEPSPASAKIECKSCHSCPMAQFGSAPQGRGQACKVSTFLFLVNGDFGMPPVACLILPPSSIKNLMGAGRTPGYLQAAKNFKDPETHRQARYYELVWTKFTLEPGGDKHDVVHCEPLAVCRNADEARALAMLRDKFMSFMENIRGDVVNKAAGEE